MLSLWVGTLLCLFSLCIFGTHWWAIADLSEPHIRAAFSCTENTEQCLEKKVEWLSASAFVHLSVQFSSNVILSERFFSLLLCCRNFIDPKDAKLAGGAYIMHLEKAKNFWLRLHIDTFNIWSSQVKSSLPFLKACDFSNKGWSHWVMECRACHLSEEHETVHYFPTIVKI